MIDELHVQDVALIHDATIKPAEGLTVLTGETGAGKSALLSAIKLLTGERADSSAVREGSEGLSVEGRLYLKGGDRDGCVVSRTVGADGRGRAHVDGRVASVRELAQGVGSSIDLCGQHEHQRLMRTQTHVELLDGWAGESVRMVRETYLQALAARGEAAAEVARLQELGRAVDSKVGDAQFVLDRIDEVHPQEGEYEELEERLPKAEHAEALLRAAATTHDALTGDEGVTDMLSAVVQGLRDVGTYDQTLSALADAVESSLIDLEDTASELRSYQDGIEVDEEALASMQLRMSQLQGLMRSYGPRMQEVFERRAEACELVGVARDGGERLCHAQQKLERCEAALSEAAAALDRTRTAAAPKLAEAINEQLALLEMGTAQIEVSLECRPRSQWGREGPSTVELLYRPAAGLTAWPLRRIASGGEISRVMLACKVVLGAADDAQTLVFDEVDAGVGGSAAVALAQVLARLAQTHQVIVVTHVAQVAVMGDRHYLVSKTAGDVPETTIREISGDERVREIARMLSGDETEASLAHACEMLEVARQRADAP